MASRAAGTTVLSASTRNRVDDVTVTPPWVDRPGCYSRGGYDSNARAGPAAQARRFARQGYASPTTPVASLEKSALMLGTAKRTLGGIVNGSRTARPSHRHAFVPLLVLFTTAVILGIIATSALAWEKPVNWEHGGATENTCDVSGCHGDRSLHERGLPPLRLSRDVQDVERGEVLAVPPPGSGHDGEQDGRRVHGDVSPRARRQELVRDDVLARRDAASRARRATARRARRATA